MDRFFLKTRTGPYRTFERLRDNRSNPGLKNSALKHRSVAQLVAEKRGYEHTQLALKSRLWSLLSGPPWTPAKREEEIDRLLHTFEFYESGPRDKFILDTLSIEDFRDLDRTPSNFQCGLRKVAQQQSLDGILLLCLLYRRHLEAGRLGEVRDVGDAVLRAIHHYCDRPGFHGEVRTLWVFITRRRVFAGQPSLEHTPQALSEARQIIAGWEAHCTTAQAQKWFDDQVWLYACNRENDEEVQRSYIIPRNPEVEGFIAARDHLWIRAVDTAVANLPPLNPNSPSTAETGFAQPPGHRE